jgi:hypothetical protein
VVAAARGVARGAVMHHQERSDVYRMHEGSRCVWCEVVRGARVVRAWCERGARFCVLVVWCEGQNHRPTEGETERQTDAKS